MPDLAHVQKWYEVVTDTSLRQGDIFRALLVFWPSRDLPLFEADPGPELDVKFEWHRGDYAITSASCDVDQRNYPYVLLSRVEQATPDILRCADKELPQQLEVRRQGLVPSQFLLPGTELIAPAFPDSIVLYKTHALVHIEYLRRNCVRPRLRLNHPHREAFGNWAGANLSRVGPETAAQVPKYAQVFPVHVLRANE